MIEIDQAVNVPEIWLLKSIIVLSNFQYWNAMLVTNWKNSSIYQNYIEEF